MTEIEHVEANAWRTSIERALARGERFAGAWLTKAPRGLFWRALLDTSTQMRVVSCEVRGASVESLIEIAPAVAWDEREAHDLFGLEFSGHRPMRALARHTQEPQSWMTPVRGDGVHQVAVGPIHAGVIESGHFRFHVVGERILALDLRLFYKHRGLECAAEGEPAEPAIAFAGRACGACSVANSVAYAHAVEDATGLRPDRRLRTVRTLLLELERLYNHLHDIGAICAGVGYAPGAMAFAALKERAQQINMGAFGHRFLFGAVCVGVSTVTLDKVEADSARARLRELRIDSEAAWRELQFTGSLHARMDGVGVLTEEDARRLGAVGPAARAAGLREDARSVSPRLAYSGFRAASLPAPGGDVGARLRLRAVELDATYEILDELLEQPIGAGMSAPAAPAGPLGVGRIESPRGQTVCAVELDGRRVARMHLRTGSYANWPALAHAAAGNLLPDFPLINKSFELCYACADR